MGGGGEMVTDMPEITKDLREQLRAEWVEALESGRYAGVIPGLSLVVIDRFLSRINFDGDGGCWLWTAAANGDGYGYIGFAWKQYRCNRLAFALKHGRFPDSLACHTCDVRLCVNPAHLFDGTLTDNNRDRAAKGRSRDQWGEKNNQCKLKAPELARVFEMREAGMLHREIAGELGVSRALIGVILGGQRRQRDIAAMPVSENDLAPGCNQGRG